MPKHEIREENKQQEGKSRDQGRGAISPACDLEAAIPAELFLAGARSLAFVFGLSPIAGAAGPVHRRPARAPVA
jgi:hypothetical protein